MTSRNELYKFIAKSLIKNGLLRHEGEVGQASGGMMYVRLGDQVYQIDLKEIDAISKHPNAVEEGKRFMSTLPHPYTEADI